MVGRFVSTRVHVVVGDELMVLLTVFSVFNFSVGQSSVLDIPIQFVFTIG